jgi:sorting nexin-29
MQITSVLESQEVSEPTMQEAKKVLQKLKNNKSPGIDTIPSELIKSGKDSLIKRIYELIRNIWMQKLPDEWKRSIICPIHKNGDLLECANYRGISLLNTAYKALSNIIYAHLLPHTEAEIGSHHYVFQPGKSTTDALLIVRQSLEKAQEKKIETHFLFIDFKAAYDSVIRMQLDKVMDELDIPGKLTRMARNTSSSICVQTSLSDPLDVTNGLRQGDALACLLFNVVLQKATKDSRIQTSGHIFLKSMQIIAYADNAVLIARTRRDLVEGFRSLESAAMRIGLGINQNKTKYMAMNARRLPDPLILEIGLYTFEHVHTFTYLGTKINKENDITQEVWNRIAVASRRYFSLQTHFKSNFISRTTKILLYKTLVHPIALYGAECWTLSRTNEKTAHVFERKFCEEYMALLRT